MSLQSRTYRRHEPEPVGPPREGVQASAPPVLVEVEEALGHPRGGKFEVCTRQLLGNVLDRVQHPVLSSHHGLVAARIVSVLRVRGRAESDVVAKDAMVPARRPRGIPTAYPYPRIDNIQ